LWDVQDALNVQWVSRIPATLLASGVRFATISAAMISGAPGRLWCVPSQIVL
jgi:hypothetical protein